MGLFLSVVLSYASINETIEIIKHILSGMLPEENPDFQYLADYYTRLLRESSNPSAANDWTTRCGQGYLCLTEDKKGKLSSAAIKYYNGEPSSTAILFSTKISSFGQDSVESESSQANGDYRTERYTPTRTKTIISNTFESFSVGNRNRSPSSCEKISDPSLYSPNSFERDASDTSEVNEAKEKLTWHYRPLSPTPKTLPEIHFQSYDENRKEDKTYSEEYLRSLDGIKFRPLQRSDPNSRRRNYKKRNSSSSNSSRDSRASREEELKMFTSLEEAEFERMNKEKNVGGFGSTPNLATRSYSRSRSRENSKEKRPESWSVEASVDSVGEEESKTELKPQLKDLPKLHSFEEKEETKETQEVMEEEEDFWGNSGD